MGGRRWKEREENEKKDMVKGRKKGEETRVEGKVRNEKERGGRTKSSEGGDMRGG